MAIGLMSGTSMDGIDVALVKTDGEAIVERGPGMEIAYEAAFRRKLADALDEARSLTDRTARPGNLAETERLLTLRHAAAVGIFLKREGIRHETIDVIGFHGQTVLHRPDEALTVQLGDGALLARETGISVVQDMRANDMKHGGQGAPLIPAYHAALGAGLPGEIRRPVAFVNIGGISNITFIGRDGEIVAFDSGPGNMLIDQWVQAHAGVPFDQGGMIASEGRVLGGLAARYLDQPFFTAPTRRSLDRNDFRPPDGADASLEDGARTLAHVTAAAILASARHLPMPPSTYIMFGGGRLNRAIMNDLATLAGEQDAKVVTAEQVGLDGGSMEAEAWAYLAVRSMEGLPLTFPGTTGVREPVTGGVLSLKGDVRDPAGH